MKPKVRPSPPGAHTSFRVDDAFASMWFWNRARLALRWIAAGKPYSTDGRGWEQSMYEWMDKHPEAWRDLL